MDRREKAFVVACIDIKAENDKLAKKEGSKLNK